MWKELCAILLLCCAGYVRSAEVGETCSSDTDCVGDGIFCEGNTCKYKAGQDCAAAIGQCLMGATCTNNMCTCGDNHTPSADMMKCLKNIGQTCSNTTECVKGSKCEGASGSMTCMCNAATEVAKDDNTMCLTKIDQPCTQDTTQCATGATCMGQAGEMKCGCDANQVVKSDNTGCMEKIGQNCSASGAMCVMGASCTNGNCTCPSNSEPNTNMDKCLMFNGGSCTESTDCVQGANFTCTDNKCACKDKYLVNAAMDMCKLKAGEACIAADDCGKNAMCNKTCTCLETSVNENGKCAVKVGESCSGDADCVMNAECREMKCSCKGDYTADGDTCKSGSAALLPSVVVMMAVFVTSRLL